MLPNLSSTTMNPQTCLHGGLGRRQTIAINQTYTSQSPMRAACPCCTSSMCQVTPHLSPQLTALDRHRLVGSPLIYVRLSQAIAIHFASSQRPNLRG